MLFQKLLGATQQRFLVDASAEFTAQNGASSVNISFSNVVSGDFLYIVARAASASGLSWVTPSGWTRIGGTTTTQGVAFSRTATGGETSVTLTGWSPSASGIAACGLHYKGVTSGPNAFVQSASSSTHNFSSITMASAGQLTCVAVATVDAPTLSTPSDMELYFTQSTTTLGERSVFVFVQDVGSGATGTRTTTRTPTGALFLGSLSHY